jgi:hypothetical protein
VAAINNTTSYPLTTSLVNSDQIIVLTNSGTYLKKITKANLETSLSINDTLLAGKIVYVDSVNGSDSTGTRGNVGLPFLTLAAAQTAASSGDQIDVYPGSYTITATLGKAGVNWNLRPGVTITATSATGTAIAVFGDGGTAKTFRVTGAGALVLSGQAPASPTISAVVSVTNASSSVQIECKSLAQNATLGENDELAIAVYQESGTLYVTADTIAVATAGYAMWWLNGELRITASDIVSAGVATLYASCNATPTGDCYVTAESIRNTSVGGSAVDGYSQNAEAKFWVRAAIITAEGIAVAGTGGKTYVTAQKIAGCTANASDSLGVVDMTGGKLWLTTHKITGTYESGILISGATQAFIDVMQIEDLGHMLRAVKYPSGTGSLDLFNARAIMAVGDGVSHAAGSALSRLSNCRFDTSASAGKNPVTVSGSGLILDHCTLIPNAAADSVTAGSAKTITNYGSVAKTAKNANVTVNVQALTVDSNVV